MKPRLTDKVRNNIFSIISSTIFVISLLAINSNYLAVEAQPLTSLNEIESFEENESVGIIITGFEVMSGGSGYTTPHVVISGGGGSGATATARVSNGVIIGVVLTNPGSGYVSPPIVTLRDPSPRAKGAFVTVAVTSIVYAEANISEQIQGCWQTSNGTLYAGHSATLYSSSDQGLTWQSILNFSASGETLDLVYVNHLNYIFTSPTAEAETNELGIWRSVDSGVTWSQVLTLPVGCSIWSMSEDSNGNLFAGVYSSGWDVSNARIYKSNDNGSTWFSIYHDREARHIHCIYVDKSDNYIYASVGDELSSWTANYIIRSTNGGITWNKILNGIPQITAITSVSGARLLATDQSFPLNGQIFRTTDDKNYSLVFDVGFPCYAYWFSSNGLNGNIYASFVSNEISTSAGIFLSTDNGMSWSVYKNFTVPEGGYFGSPTASNFVKGTMYYSVLLGSGYQNGVRIYLNTNTSSQQNP